MTDHNQAAIDAMARAIGTGMVIRRGPRELASDALAAARPHLEAAERERIRWLTFGCRTCGRVHELRKVTRGTVDRPVEGQTWADPADGHAYDPQIVASGEAGRFLHRILTEGDQS